MWWAMGGLVGGAFGLAVFIELARRAPLMEETEHGLVYVNEAEVMGRARTRPHPVLDRDVQTWLGRGLQATFQSAIVEPIPSAWTALAASIPSLDDGLGSPA